jgi:hypothetical protein
MPENPYQPPKEVNEPVRAGCAPKLGCGLLILGSLLLLMTTRIAWLNWGRPAVGEETWNRVVVWSTIGVTFVLSGAFLAVFFPART